MKYGILSLTKRSYHMRAHLTLLALTMVAISATAANADTGRLPNRGESIPVVELTTLAQKDGESNDQFMARAGQWGKNYTTGTNEEICANVCSSPSGQLSMRLFTNTSHLACATMSACSAGSAMTGDTFHTHPVDEQFSMNDADRSFVRDRSASANIVARHANFSAEGRDFSDADYAGGPGYVVAKGKLLYQHGRGTSHVVVDLDQ
jgi:hypothetical protein